MKDFLNKVIASKEKEIENTRAMIKKSDSADEVRALGETLDKLLNELQDAKDQLAKVEDDGNGNPADERGLNPIASYSNGKKPEARKNNDPLATMEYREAFMNYVQKGTSSELLKRDAGVAADLGVLLPTTIVQEIIKGVEKVYGQLYSRVRKTNLKGGVKYPLGTFGATFSWIGEGSASERQNGGKVTGYVEFSYHIGECRISVSLLQSVMGVEVFEKELANVILEAYVKEMDHAILLGAGTTSPTGILTAIDTIPSSNIITLNATEIADWKSWQKKVFAKIPLAFRALRPEFVMNAGTYEANILTLEDKNGRPVAKEVYNPVTGDETATFRTRNVVFVEDDMLKAYDDAAADEAIAMYWVPEKAYAINTNLQFGIKRYFDEEKNEYVNKGLVIADGKILDAKYIYIIKKAA